MIGKSKLLWIGELPVRRDIEQGLADRWQIEPYSPAQSLSPQLKSASVALISPNGEANDPRRMGKLLEQIEQSSAVGIILLPHGARTAWAMLARRRGQFLCVPQDIPLEQLSSMLTTAESLQPTIRDLHGELESAQGLLAGHTPSITELDEEMRLAARLQRDFLPRRLPEVGPVRFSVLYRPAGWVSGDIYDVTRLDETRLGFYVVDAVGHGMPAALFTMFVKTALITKRIANNSYEIVPPHEAMTQLNHEICEQNFTTFPFCTCVYGVLDVETLECTLCRAGHPAPLIIRPDGSIDQAEAPGSLLGVFPDEQYESRRLTLSPGERLLLYSDGVEAALGAAGPKATPLADAIAPFVKLPRQEMLLQMTSRMEAMRSRTPDDDDVTVVLVEVLR